MGYFVVVRDIGPAWDHTLSMSQQKSWTEHAEFMNSLADEGFVVLGGPIGDGKRIQLVIRAEDENDVVDRLAQDPWGPMRLLGVSSIEPWDILLGNLPS